MRIGGFLCIASSKCHTAIPKRQSYYCNYLYKDGIYMTKMKTAGHVANSTLCLGAQEVNKFLILLLSIAELQVNFV